MLYTSNSIEMLEEFKASMFSAFEMTDTGLMSYFLSIEVNNSKIVSLYSGRSTRDLGEVQGE